MLLPKLKVRELFPAPPNSSPKHGFRAHNNDYLGIQFGVNNVSDLLWDHDDLGGWRGPAWASVYPYQFSIIGATETRNPATQDSANFSSTKQRYGVIDYLPELGLWSSISGDSGDKIEYSLDLKTWHESAQLLHRAYLGAYSPELGVIVMAGRTVEAKTSPSAFSFPFRQPD